MKGIWPFCHRPTLKRTFLRAARRPLSPRSQSLRESVNSSLRIPTQRPRTGIYTHLIAVKKSEQRVSCRAQKGTRKEGAVACRGINPRAFNSKFKARTHHRAPPPASLFCGLVAHAYFTPDFAHTGRSLSTCLLHATRRVLSLLPATMVSVSHVIWVCI